MTGARLSNTQDIDEAILTKIRKADWTRSLPYNHFSSEFNKERGGSPPTYRAYFGKDIGAVVAFLDRMKTNGQTLGTHASANFESKKGFVIISSWELERLGVVLLGADNPSRYR